MPEQPPAGPSPNGEFPIRPTSQLWEIIFHHRATEAVFKQYEEETGQCLCCQHLFESLEDTARRYGLDLEEMLKRLDQAAKG